MKQVSPSSRFSTRRYALSVGAASPTGEAMPQALRSNSKFKIQNPPTPLYPLSS
ncbi:hypothetical protein NIES23_22130 [Trichormus variabilis NIES-23]|uniref:Uncharacterized protein n=1 Tax=Trichormus variabilis NIES-23 TaxID=1973479 RepID=A0A1Z4KKB7_ANAVA|nr:hypothetical protein NIES23_22130 [Trichormus variabilis NIES-23]